MKLNFRTLLLFTACLALTGAAYTQDSNDQSLGDVVRKDQAKPKAKAKVTLDEDNSQPAPPAEASNTSSGNDAASGPQAQDPASTDQSPDKTTPSQTPPSSPSSAQDQAKAKLSALDNEEKSLKSGIEMLQDRIADPQSGDDAKRVWQDAVTHSQDRLAAIEKEKQALQSASGSDAQQAPASQPANNPQQ